jgi:hypothetical protein
MRAGISSMHGCLYSSPVRSSRHCVRPEVRLLWNHFTPWGSTGSGSCTGTQWTYSRKRTGDHRPPRHDPSSSASPFPLVEAADAPSPWPSSLTCRLTRLRSMDRWICTVRAFECFSALRMRCCILRAIVITVSSASRTRIPAEREHDSGVIVNDFRRSVEW